MPKGFARSIGKAVNEAQLDDQKLKLVRELIDDTEDGEISWDAVLTSYYTTWKNRRIIVDILPDDPPKLFVMHPHIDSQAVVEVVGRQGELRAAMQELDGAIQEKLPQLPPPFDREKSAQVARTRQLAAEKHELDRLLG